MEDRFLSTWYRLRGLGLIALCLGLVWGGRMITEQKSVAVNSAGGGRELPVYCVQTDEKKAALTFDAAWGNEDTQTILKILQKYNVRASFFVTGGWVEHYPEDVKAIAAAGHDLGNHSQNHKNMSQLSTEEIRQEILTVDEKVKELTGSSMKLFRAPYGDYDNELIRAVKDCGYLPIQWDVDSEDWKNYGIESILEKVTAHKHLGNGSIILMHNGGEYTAMALESVIQRLQEQGYTLVPVSELVYWEDYSMDAEGRQIPKHPAKSASADF